MRIISEEEVVLEVTAAFTSANTTLENNESSRSGQGSNLSGTSGFSFIPHVSLASQRACGPTKATAKRTNEANLIIAKIHQTLNESQGGS